MHTQDTQNRFLEKQYLTEFSKVLNLFSLVYSYFLFIYVVNKLSVFLYLHFCDCERVNQLGFLKFQLLPNALKKI